MTVCFIQLADFPPLLTDHVGTNILLLDLVVPKCHRGDGLQCRSTRTVARALLVRRCVTWSRLRLDTFSPFTSRISSPTSSRPVNNFSVLLSTMSSTYTPKGAQSAVSVHSTAPLGRVPLFSYQELTEQMVPNRDEIRKHWAAVKTCLPVTHP